MITFPLIAVVPVVVFALMLETVRARASQGRVVEIEEASRTMRFPVRVAA